jgi:hypothetical protein
MRTSLRLFTAAVSVAVAGAFLAIVPSASPASAQTGFAINQVNVGSATANEGDGTISFTVSLANRVGGAVSVTLKTQDLNAEAGKDYQQTQQTLSWGATEGGTKQFTVPLINDTLREPSEQFLVTFASAPTGSGATAGNSGTGTITDNDAGTVPTITVTPAGSNSFNEGTGGDNIRLYNVTLDTVGSEPVSVNYKTVDGTAKNGSDFTGTDSATLTWPAATNPPAPKQVQIPIMTDSFGEPNEQFQLIFAINKNAALAPNPNQLLTIQNDDGAVPAITIDPIPPKTEGDSGTSNLTVTLKATNTGGQPVTVDVETVDGTAVASTQQSQGDYVPLVKTTVTIPTTGSKTVDVPIVGDRAQEQDETFTIHLSNPNNATIGGNDAVATIVNDDLGQITTGVGPGGGPHVKTFGSAGAELGSFFAFGANNTGGVHVARGDIFNAQSQPGADGIDEIIVGTGRIPSGNLRSTPTVSVFNVSGTLLATFLAYDSGFGGGVYVAAGNFDGNPQNGDEIVTGTGAGGGPHIRVFHVNSGGSNAQVIDISNGGFFAYAPQVNNGMRVAAGNLVGDSRDEIVTAPGPGAGSHVRVWTLNNNNAYAVAREFFAYPGFNGGVSVAASAGRIVTGPGAGGGPHVKVFNADGNNIAGWFAYDSSFTGGVNVATGNLDTTPSAEIVTGPGGGGGPHVRVFDQNGGLPFGNGFFAYQNWTGPVEVSVGSFG